jgi:hypothetical protein
VVRNNLAVVPAIPFAFVMSHRLRAARPIRPLSQGIHSIVSPDIAQEYHNLRAFLPFSTPAFISKYAVSMSF